MTEYTTIIMLTLVAIGLILSVVGLVMRERACRAILVAREEVAEAVRLKREAERSLEYLTDSIYHDFLKVCREAKSSADIITRNTVRNGANGFEYYIPEERSLERTTEDDYGSQQIKTEYGEFRTYAIRFRFFVPRGQAGLKVLHAAAWAHGAKLVAEAIEEEAKR